MDAWRRYVLGTWGYVVTALASLGFAVYFLLRPDWLLVGICVLMTLVALDNVFCGTRLRTAGCSVRGRYASPLRRRPRA